jgi:hypothetical protein
MGRQWYSSNIGIANKIKNRYLTRKPLAYLFLIKKKQNIRRHNYCCKDGEIGKRVYCNATFWWRPPSSGVLFLDCMKEGE